MKEYYHFVGQSAAGDDIDFESEIALTEDEAYNYAYRELERCGGGYVDVFNADSEKYLFDVEFHKTGC